MIKSNIEIVKEKEETQNMINDVKNNFKERIKSKSPSKKSRSVSKNKRSKSKKKNRKKEQITKKAFDYEKYKISNRYQMLKEIGQGSFGEVILCYDLHNNKLICLKFEEEKSKQPQLLNEYEVLKALNSDGKVEGFTKCYDYNKSGNNFNYIVIDFLGPNLADLLITCGGKFSIITTCLVGIQIINRLETLHEKGYLHRDIKPENFLVGLDDDSNVIHAIDFGLAKKYKDKNFSSQHIPYKEGKLLTGTARYASVNSHLGIENSRRDDIESLVYLLVYLAKGKRPWQHTSSDDKELEKLTTKKLKISAELLCENLPKQFIIFFQYCKSIKFEERPDYNFLKTLLNEVLYSIVDYDKLEITIPEEILSVEKEKIDNRVSYHQFMELIDRDIINVNFLNEIYLTSNSNIIFTEKNFTFIFDWQINYKDKEALAVKYNDNKNGYKIDERSESGRSQYSYSD